MKKEYEKPELIAYEDLTTITAQNLPVNLSNMNG